MMPIGPAPVTSTSVRGATAARRLAQIPDRQRFEQTGGVVADGVGHGEHELGRHDEELAEGAAAAGPAGLDRARRALHGSTSPVRVFAPMPILGDRSTIEI